jgi:carboxylesterase
MKKHLFYSLKSFLIIFFLSLIVLSEYGIPFHDRLTKSYINYNKLWNAKAYLKNSDPVVKKNKNSKKAALLIHGYAGTPYNVKSAALMLYKMGYDVYAPLLPGHGTNVNDMKTTTFADWYLMVKKAYNYLSQRYNEIIAVGCFTGGSLLLKLVIEENPNFNSLILINAPVMLFGYTRGHYYLNDIRLLFSGILRLFLNRFPEDIMGTEYKPVAPWQGYENFNTMHHVHFLKVRLRKIKKHCFRVKCPVLLITSARENYVPVQNANYIYEHINSEKKALIKLGKIKNDPVEGKHVLIHRKYKSKIISFIANFINNKTMKKEENEGK